MMFNCPGFITGWSAHTLIRTEPNFIEFLSHTITFQVWRPASHYPQRYSLVGSNKLNFQADSFENLRRIPGQNTMAYFNFTNKIVPHNKQIHFMAGDIVGWFISARFNTISPPLSVLYANITAEDNPGDGVTMYIWVTSQEPCVVCDIQESNADMFTSVIPFVSVVYETSSVVESCMPSICNTSLSPTNTLLTVRSVKMSSTMTLGLNNKNRVTIDKAAAISIILAAMIFIMLLIQVIFCGYSMIMLNKLHRTLKEVHMRTTSRRMLLYNGGKDSTADQNTTVQTQNENKLD